MGIERFMSKPVETITADATLQEAAFRMSIRDVGLLPVIREGHLAGTITDRDIVVKAVAQGLPTDRTTVAEVMSSDVVTCDVKRSLDEAARLMSSAKVRRLIVVDGNCAVGVMSLGDVARASDDPQLVSRTVSDVT